jgi:large repetitive protein
VFDGLRRIVARSGQRRRLARYVALGVGLPLVVAAPALAAFIATDTNAANSFNANGTFPAFYHPRVISQTPWLYHEMDDVTGNTATDSSGNARNGTYSASTGSGTIASTAGATTGDGDTAVTLGGATANNGTAGTGVCGYAVSDGLLATTSTYTVEVWFKTANNTGGMLVDSGWYTTPSGFSPTNGVDRYVYLRSDSHVEFGTGTGTHAVASPFAMDDGAWHLVDATSSNGSIDLYIDGASVGTATASNPTSNGNWRVGCDDTTALPMPPIDNGFNGSIDDVAIYPGALSAAQVTAHWNARTTATYASTITADAPTLYWRLDSPTPDGRVSDTSSNANIGHYFNMAAGGSVTLGAGGALVHAQASSTAATYSRALGVNPLSQNVATTYAATEEVWFKTAAGYNQGGAILALADTPSGAPSVFERIIWMDNTGLIHFGVNSGGTLKVLNTASAYDDGAWHLVDASLGASGEKLYIDGTLVASDATVTTGQADATAYWRWGYSAFGFWSPQPTSFFFNGSLDEIAVYNAQLTDAAVAADFAANY